MLNHLFHHMSFLSLGAKATKAHLIISLNINLFLCLLWQTELCKGLYFPVFFGWPP